LAAMVIGNVVGLTVLFSHAFPKTPTGI